MRMTSLQKITYGLLLVVGHSSFGFAQDGQFPDDNFEVIPVTAPEAEELTGVDKILSENGIDPTGLGKSQKKRLLMDLNTKKKWFENATREAKRTGSYSGLTLEQLRELGPVGLDKYLKKQEEAELAAAKKNQPVVKTPDPMVAQFKILQQQQQSIWQMQRQIERMEQERIRQADREMLGPTVEQKMRDREYIEDLFSLPYKPMYGGGYGY